jgi:hypothetical protein
MSLVNTKSAALAALAVAAAVSSAAQAATVSPTKANGQFINGSGVPANNFTVATGGGVEVALKARGFNALAGQPLSYDGINTYQVSTGYATGRDPASTPGNTRAWWSLDYQFTPSAGSLPTDYVVRLEQDVDPAVGATNYFVSQGSPAGVASGGPLGQFDSDGFHANPGPGAWTDNSIPFVHAQSWNYEFNFYPASYDPNAAGEYQVNMTAYLASDVTFSTPLASSTIFVNAVPEPTGLGLIGLGGIALLGRRNRRKTVTA